MDFDGVIADTNLLKSHNIYQAVLKFKDDKVASDFREYFNGANGLPREEKVAAYFSDQQLESKILKEYRLLNANLLDALMTHRLEHFLLSVKDKEVVVLSGGDYEEINAYLTANQVREYFVDILAGPSSKVEHLQSARLTGDELFIGDSSYDFEVAQKFGMDFILMTGYRNNTDDIVPGPVTQIVNLDELIAL